MKSNNEQNEKYMWEISIMIQRKIITCYHCDTILIKRLKYYGNPMYYKFDPYSIMIDDCQNLIIEFLDRSNLEFERGYLLKMGYESTENDSTMTILKKQEDMSKVKEKYNLEPPKAVPEVPNFYFTGNIFACDDNCLHQEFKDNFWNCLPKYKLTYNEFMECVKDKGIHYENINIDKNEFTLDDEVSKRGVRRTYTYKCPENSIIVINSKNIEKETKHGMYID